MNHVTLTGNLTKDIEIEEFSNQGSSWVRARGTLAVDAGFDRKANSRKTYFIPIVAWGAVAERIAQRCKKGSRLFIEGELVIEQFDNNGTYVTYSQVRVNSFEEFSVNRISQEQAKPQVNNNSVMNNMSGYEPVPDGYMDYNGYNQTAPAANGMGAPVAQPVPVQPTPIQPAPAAPVPAKVEPVQDYSNQSYGYMGEDDPNYSTQFKPLPENKMFY